MRWYECKSGGLCWKLSGARVKLQHCVTSSLHYTHTTKFMPHDNLLVIVHTRLISQHTVPNLRMETTYFDSLHGHKLLSPVFGACEFGGLWLLLRGTLRDFWSILYVFNLVSLQSLSFSTTVWNDPKQSINIGWRKINFGHFNHQYFCRAGPLGNIQVVESWKGVIQSLREPEILNTDYHSQIASCTLRHCFITWTSNTWCSETWWCQCRAAPIVLTVKIPGDTHSKPKPK